MDWEATPDPDPDDDPMDWEATPDPDPDDDPMDWEATPDPDPDDDPMDWEATPDPDPTLEPMKREGPTSKTRFMVVVRRTNPLYWHDPMLCLKEYGSARLIRAPGRWFASNGRTLSSILEEPRVHFAENDFTDDVDGHVDVDVHVDIDFDDDFDVDAVDEFLVEVSEDDGLMVDTTPPLVPDNFAILESVVEPGPIDITVNDINDDVDDDFDVDAVDDFPVEDSEDDHGLMVDTTPPLVPDNFAVLESVVGPEPTTTTDTVSGPGKMPPLRRSKRLALIRARLHQENCSNQGLDPELLGSTFVNGRRRSARLLTKKTVDYRLSF
jgi:hypothetical protein